MLCLIVPIFRYVTTSTSTIKIIQPKTQFFKFQQRKKEKRKKKKEESKKMLKNLTKFNSLKLFSRRTFSDTIETVDAKIKKVAGNFYIFLLLLHLLIFFSFSFFFNFIYLI